MRINPGPVFLTVFFALLPSICFGAPASVSYSAAPAQVDVYDFAEITATVASPDAHDPFEDATLTGALSTEDGSQHWDIEGFCDSDNGSIFRIRFMAPQRGGYKYSVTYRQGGFEKTATGTFRAVDAHKRGTIGVDPEVSLALYLGGDRGTLLLQRYNGILAHGLARRTHHSIQH